ncbi:MAG: IS200/IS605 family transposase [Chitinophagaceae bacterium]
MSYIKIWIHAVWATKNRAPLMPEIMLKKICDHIHYNCHEKGIILDKIGGHVDHLHALMRLKPEYSISKQMQLIKGESSSWVNKSGIMVPYFEWADKFFATSVSHRAINRVRNYIAIQKEHHAKESFEMEQNRFIKSLGFEEHDG